MHYQATTLYRPSLLWYHFVWKGYWEMQYLDTALNEEVSTRFYDALDVIFKERTSPGNPTLGYLGGEGIFPDPPEPVVENYRLAPSGRPSWNNKGSNGLIVMTDMWAGKSVSTLYPKITKDIRDFRERSWFNHQAVLGSFIKPPVNWMPLTWSFEGYYLGSPAWVDLDYYYVNLDSALNYANVQTNECYEEFSPLMGGMNSRLITQVYGEANRGTLDAMTELAEMPSTLREIYSLLNGILSIIQSFRRREFNLSKAFLQSQKRLEEKRDRMLQQIQESHPGIRTRADARRLAKLKREVVLQAKKDLARTRREFHDATSNLWLGYRYTLETSIMSVEDALTTYGATMSNYLTYRAYEKSDLSDQYTRYYNEKNVAYDLEVSCEIYYRENALVKRMIRNTSGAGVQNLLGGNILLTALELTPWFLVVDWVLNIGDFVSAITPNVSFDDEKVSYSRKLEVVARYFHDGVLVREITSEQYVRLIIDPLDYISVNVEDTIFTWRRLADLQAWFGPRLVDRATKIKK